MAQMKEFCAKLKVGSRQTHRNMRVRFSLSADEAPVDSLTRDNALVPGVLSIKEMSGGGPVPELGVLNKFERTGMHPKRS